MYVVLGYLGPGRQSYGLGLSITACFDKSDLAMGPGIAFEFTFVSVGIAFGMLIYKFIIP